MQLTLPEPSADEQAHCQNLCNQIISEIHANQGRIPFSRFMEMALYTPGMGYYMAGNQKFGTHGDFVTAAEISPLFADCLAFQTAQILQQTGDASVLECGAGSGVMAADILLRLERLQRLPQHYYILELSVELAQRQRQTLQNKVPHLLGRVCWLHSLEGFSMQGVVLANELLDAMPVNRFIYRDGQVFELYVGYQNDRFVWQADKPSAVLQPHLQPLLETYADAWPAGYQSELNPLLPGWMQTMSDCVSQGAMLLCDYGYTAAEYYHPERTDGTLIGHYRHHVCDDPLRYPGLQDLSASVDFNAVAKAAAAAGLGLAGYTSQSAFLLGAGLDRWYAERLEAAPQEALQLAQQVKQLTLPSEMGERFQVIAFTKSLDCELAGFGFRDLSHRL